MGDDIETGSNADDRHPRALTPEPPTTVRRRNSSPAPISSNSCAPFRPTWRQAPSPDSDESMSSLSASAGSPPSARTSPIRSARVTFQSTDPQTPTSRKRPLNTRPLCKNTTPGRPPPALRQATPGPVTWANAETESEGDPSPPSHRSIDPHDSTSPPDDPTFTTQEGLQHMSHIFEDTMVLDSTTGNTLAHGEDAGVGQTAEDQDEEMKEGGNDGKDGGREQVARTGEDTAGRRPVMGERRFSTPMLRRNALVLSTTGRKRTSSGGSDTGNSNEYESGSQGRKDGRKFKRLKGKENLE